MGNSHLDSTAMAAIEAYMADNPELTSKSRAVISLISTADKARVLEIAVDALKDENERLRNLRGA